jgi:predicted transcriptional regulator
MTTLTIKIPDELATRIAKIPLETVNYFAVSGIEAGLNDEEREEYTEEDYAEIGAALEDVEAGRMQPAEAFFQEFAARHGFSLKERK